MTKDKKETLINKNSKERIKPIIFSRNRFSFDDEEDTGWLMSMSDLMSLLLVFFLVWTAVNVPALEKKKRSYKETEKIDVIKQANLQQSTIKTEENGIKERVYEFIPTNLKNNFVVVAFKQLGDKNKEDDIHGTGKRAMVHLEPVDMQVVSIE